MAMLYRSKRRVTDTNLLFLCLLGLGKKRRDRPSASRASEKGLTTYRVWNSQAWARNSLLTECMHSQAWARDSLLTECMHSQTWASHHPSQEEQDERRFACSVDISRAGNGSASCLREVADTC